MKKTATISYYLLLVMGMLLVLLANVSRSTGIYEKYEGNTGAEIEPAEVVHLSEDVREFHFSEGISDNECLLFFSNHQSVRVYADETLIYAVAKNNTIFGKTPGAYWNFVTISEETTEIIVQVEAVYPQVRDNEISFWAGDEKELYHGLVRYSIPETLISIIDILIGIYMLFYWLVARKRGHGDKSTMFFGLFATLLGLWSLNETILVRLMLENRVAGAFDAYIFLMLMMIPYIHFIESFLEVEHKTLANIFSIVCSINIFMVSILHFTGIYEFKQTLFVTHILIVLEFIYSIVAVFIRKKHRGFDRKVKISLVGIFGFFCAFVADMFAYYIGMKNTDVLGRDALLVYILLLGYEVLIEALERSDEWQKAEIYRELAIKDTLTGLYNRNAYNQWLEEHGKEQDVAILMCDLNDLKKCNDTRGHAVGDSYIMGAADIISRVFEGQGTCYRIGGDEFCVILKDAENVDIQDKIRQLAEMEDECNRMMAEMKINIAYGYAVFDDRLDANIEDTCKRADQEMYRNKKERKRLNA
ncbi:MAG: diguanylate cyclase domain-containing protein [Roseburia sp.]